MVIAHSAYILLVAAALIATVLSPFYTDIFQTGDIWVKHYSGKIFIVLLERLTLASLIIVAVSAIYFILVTHKICGPLVNIGRTIARISEGDFTRKIHLRRGDFLKKEAKQINAMMQSLSNSIADIKRENLMLIEDIEENIQSYGRQAGGQAKLKEFQKRAHRCRVQLDQFKIIDDGRHDVGTCQCEHLVKDNTISANKCKCI